MSMAILRELMVKNVLDLKISMNTDSAGKHQVVNWDDKHNSIHNVVKLKNVNKSLH